MPHIRIDFINVIFPGVHEHAWCSSVRTLLSPGSISGERTLLVFFGAGLVGRVIHEHLYPAHYATLLASLVVLLHIMDCILLSTKVAEIDSFGAVLLMN